MKKDFVVKGFIPVTMTDWPGKIASMVFTPKCNFKCPFCYNTELVLAPQKLSEIEPQKIIEHLKKKRKWLDGLVIGGGEPTLWPGLIKFAKKVKDAGFQIQLQTNGTNPKVLSELIKKKLVDYLAMDIKGPLAKYQEITRSKINPEDIKKSSELIKQSLKIESEFRTTIVPGLIKKEDIKQIGKDFGGNVSYFLQQFSNEKTLDPRFLNIEPYPIEMLEQMQKIAEKYFKKVEIRGV